VSIAAANGLVIFVAIYFEWSLFEIALAYAGELAILALVAIARVLAANRLDPRRPEESSPANLRLGKFYAVVIVILMYSLVLGIISILLLGLPTFPKPDIGLIPASTLRWLAGCWLLFFVSHAIAFVSLVKVGAYETLISDARVMLPILRHWPLLLASVGAGAERYNGASIQPWFYVLVLALMAVVNSVARIVELTALRNTPGVPRNAQPAE